MLFDLQALLSKILRAVAQLLAQLSRGAPTLHQFVNNLNVLFLIVVMGQSNGKHKS
jgi:ABC-type transporter Mla subunit MlaD